MGYCRGSSLESFLFIICIDVLHVNGGSMIYQVADDMKIGDVAKRE